MTHASVARIAGPKPAAGVWSAPAREAPLTLSQPGDRDEVEADRIADAVLARAPSAAGRSAAVGAASQAWCGTVHRQCCSKCSEEDDQARVQRKPGASAPAAPSHASLEMRGGAPLPASVRRDLEAPFGHDFSSVRVHTDARVAQAAQGLSARAFTIGTDVAFAPGEFQPATAGGRRLLAHELVHVIQQTGGAPHRGKDAVAAVTESVESAQSSAGRPVTVQKRTGAPRLQGFWVTTEPAGGCGICYGEVSPKPAQVAGTTAHGVIQNAFKGVYRLVEFPYSSPTDENGRLDLAIATPSGFKIGEIKPANKKGEEDGIKDLAWYRRTLLAAYPDSWIEPIDVRVPGSGHTMPDPLAAFAGCPLQTLGVTVMQPGLYGYWCAPRFSEARRQCRCRRDEDKKPPSPPIPLQPDLQPGESETKGKGGDQPRKGNGERGKGDRPGNGQPGKGDGGRRPGPTPQRLPDWIPEAAAVLAILGAIVAFLSKTPQGRLGAFLGTLLGRILKWLGFGLVFGLGTAPASPGGSGSGGLGPSRSTPGKTITVPGKDLVVPGGTVVVPGGTDPTGPPVGTIPEPSRPTRTKKKAPPAKAPLFPKKAPKLIKLAAIEGLRLDTLSVGTLTMAEIDPGGPKERLVVLTVKNVQRQGREVTVEFESVLAECSLRGDECSSGGNVYTVTHPYRGEREGALNARAVKEVGNTEGMDETVKQFEKLIR